MIKRAALIGARAERGAATSVSEVMQREFPTADPFEMAGSVLPRLQESTCLSMPVLHQNNLVGLPTAGNLGEFLTIQTALRGGKPTHAATTRQRISLRCGIFHERTHPNQLARTASKPSRCDT